MNKREEIDLLKLQLHCERLEHNQLKAMHAKQGQLFSSMLKRQAEPTAFQHFWSCEHHPSAMENYWSELRACSNGCKQPTS